MIPVTSKAYKLLHEGAVALAEVEANGIRVDEDYLKKATAKTKKKIARVTDQLKKSDGGRLWVRRFGVETKLSSHAQLGAILIDRGHSLERTASTAHYLDGHPKINYKTDEAAIENLGDPFIKIFLEREKLKKLQNTYLKNIAKETIRGYAHVNFNLHRVRTYRSSSSDFNFQNLPIRDPIYGEIVRRCFIARKGCRIVEFDIGGAEVGVGACYHLDPRMIEYITNPKLDMHRDMAAQAFKLKKKEVTKETRYAGKNMFVFPQFYGDYYLNNAKQMWEYMQRMKLTTVSGTMLEDHLNMQGITDLGPCISGQRPVPGTFEAHMRDVQNHFWDVRFKVYRDWKKSWYAAYLKEGSFRTKTGFRLTGVYGRNDAINYPVQGSAFHCLLQCLIWINRELRKRRMKSRIVGQIHDSVVGDVKESETDDYLVICNTAMTEWLPDAWKWLKVPLSIDAEVAPVGGTWFDKKDYPIPAH